MRRDILRSVYDGKITPERADKLAREKGLKPFVAEPDPKEFPVMAEAMWSIEMVIAWIIWRRDSEVVRFLKSFRDQLIQWKYVGLRLNGGSLHHYRLETKPPLNLKVVEHETRYSDRYKFRVGKIAPLVSFDEAKRELWTALANGKVKAWAFSLKLAAPFEVPAEQWSFIEYLETEEGSTKLKFTLGEEPEYCDVKLKLSDVVEAWRPIKGALTKGVDSLGSNNKPKDRSDHEGHNGSLWPSSKKQRDIHAAIQVLSSEGPLPEAPGHLRKAINHYLKTKGHYSSPINDRTFQRYAEWLRKTKHDN
jgi:hypothetical protein